MKKTQRGQHIIHQKTKQARYPNRSCGAHCVPLKSKVVFRKMFSSILDHLNSKVFHLCVRPPFHVVFDVIFIVLFDVVIVVIINIIFDVSYDVIFDVVFDVIFDVILDVVFDVARGMECWIHLIP